MLLIINPSAHAGRSRNLRAFWLRELKRRRVPFTVAETLDKNLARELARDSVEAVVVAVGGDGTINEVLDGVLQSGTPKTMGVLYAGTSPDFCRFNRIPFDDPAAALDTLLNARTRRIDAARISMSHARAAHFACSCNVGLGASVAAFANANRRYLGDFLGTGLGLLLAVSRHQRFAARLILDGTSYDFRDANHFLILKNPYVASGLRLNLPLAPDDGTLTVLAVHGQSRFDLLRLLPYFYSGEAVTHPAVSTFNCRSVTLEAEPDQTVEFDGDPRGLSPITVNILPRALTLICEVSHA